MTHRAILTLITVFSVTGTFLRAQSLVLPPILADGMVLQQRSTVSLWGEGIPGSVVRLSASWGARGADSVDRYGRWKIAVKTPKAGGPYEIAVAMDTSLRTIRDVLVGEVWLCSGQSNMEMPMRGFPPNELIAGAQHDIAAAELPALRMFTVERVIDVEPRRTANGTWTPCTPATAPEFSATAFYFGRTLQKTLKVPIGLIHASWGGTPAEAWTSAPFVSTIPRFAEAAGRLRAAKAQNEALQQWLAALPSVQIARNRAEQDWRGLDFGDRNLNESGTFDSAWKSMDLPRGWEATEVGAFDGVIWFRRRIALLPEMRGKELSMTLGPIDDVDAAFVNGKKIGGMETGSPWNQERRYTVPAALTIDSVMSIAVRVTDFGGGGGFWGNAGQMSLSLPGSDVGLSLAGKWKYLPVAEIRGNEAYLFSSPAVVAARPASAAPFDANQPSTLYNGMIAPLTSYDIAGVIWYQGESNTADPVLYDTLFPLMVRNWRSDWNKELPFYYVQIAPYEYGAAVRSQRLRESQFKALSLPKSGMAVTLDIGDSVSIHPADKKHVGERLARWALAKQYGRTIVYSGPLYRSMRVKHNAAILEFDHAEGLTLKPERGAPLFMIAGPDRIFHPAVAAVKRKTVIVRSPAVPVPVAVRYGWRNVVNGTLFNGAGLPASSFRTDMWEE